MPRATRALIARITPARAGKSRFLPLCSAAGGDHPRACGEKFFLLRLLPRRLGSPPRVRGKELPSRARSSPGGITPARAGKSHGRRMENCVARDHPRACGEKWVGIDTPRLMWGSPPRVRGKGTHRTARDLPSRITPARAGKRIFVNSSNCLTRDHPRACGEKPAVWDRIEQSQGSPPRVRGKVDATIPIAMYGWDHPRACGGFLFRHNSLLSGITPARAGKSEPVSRSIRPSGDHPRACGEK